MISYSDEAFGVTEQGAPVRRWTIDDGELSLGVLDLGGVIHSLHVPSTDGDRTGSDRTGSDRTDDRTDVVLGFDDVAGYEHTRTFMGGIIGRVANRIAGGRFSIDGTEYQVATNEGPNTVHGGPVGFNQRIWTVRPVSVPGSAGLCLELVSEAGDQGFPGRLELAVTYLLAPGRRLLIRYEATTDAPTVLNPTQHSYFNLSGAPTLDGHTLQVFAGHYTPVDAAGLPRGEEAHVVGTPFDLRKPQELDFLTLDHNFVVDGWDNNSLKPAAVLSHERSGRRLEISTTEPGLQVYTGTGFDGSDVGKDGRHYRAGAAVALESQHLPDSPNQPAYPGVVLRPGEEWYSETEWKF